MSKKVKKPLTLRDYYDYREGKKYSKKKSAKHRAFKLVEKLTAFPTPLHEAWKYYDRNAREAMFNTTLEHIREAKKGK